jgi:hypothetical protein
MSGALLSSSSGFLTEPSAYLVRPCQVCTGDCGGFELQPRPELRITPHGDARAEESTVTARDALGQLGLMTLWISDSLPSFLSSVDLAIVDDEAALPHKWHWQTTADELEIEFHSR